MNASARVRVVQWWDLPGVAAGRHCPRSGLAAVAWVQSGVSLSRIDFAPIHCWSGGACRELRCRAASAAERRRDPVDGRAGYQDGLRV